VEEFGVAFEREVRNSAPHHADQPPALAHRVCAPAPDPRQLNLSMHASSRGATRRLLIDYTCARHAMQMGLVMARHNREIVLIRMASLHQRQAVRSRRGSNARLLVAPPDGIVH
jgi:hypothetical protein